MVDRTLRVAYASGGTSLAISLAAGSTAPREHLARRRGESMGTYPYATRESFELAPLPCWKHLPPTSGAPEAYLTTPYRYAERWKLET
jgi:hypothetical protein